MSSNSTNIGEQGQFLALLAAVNTLSTDKILGSSHTSASQSQSNDEQSIALINSYNNHPSNTFLTREAKVEMASMAPMDEPAKRASNHVNDPSTVVDDPLPLENIVLSNRHSLQPSPMTAPSLSTFLHLIMLQNKLQWK
jgi:hypothetical protein